MEKRVSTVPNERPRRKIIVAFNVVFILLLVAMIIYPIVFFTPPVTKLDEIASKSFFRGLINSIPSLVYEPFHIDVTQFKGFSEIFIAFLSFYLWFLVLIVLVLLLYGTILLLVGLSSKKVYKKATKITLEIFALIVDSLCLIYFVLYCLPQSIEDYFPFINQNYNFLARWFDDNGILRNFNFFKNSYISVVFYATIIEIIINIIISGYVIITTREKKSYYGLLVKEVKKGGNRPIMQEKQDYQIIPSCLFTKKRKHDSNHDFSSSVGYKMATDSFDNDDDKKLNATNQESRIIDSLEPVNLDNLNKDETSSENLDSLISSNELSKKANRKEKKAKKEKKDERFAENNEKISEISSVDVYKKESGSTPSKKELKRLAKEEKKARKLAKKQNKKNIEDNVDSIESKESIDVNDGVMIIKGENPKAKNDDKSTGNVEDKKNNRTVNSTELKAKNEMPAERKKETKQEKLKLEKGEAIQPSDGYDTSMTLFNPDDFGKDMDVSQSSDAVYGDTFPGEEDDMIRKEDSDEVYPDNITSNNAKVVYETIHEYKYSTEQTTLFKRWQDKFVRFFDVFYIVIFVLLALISVLLFTPLRETFFEQFTSLYYVRQLINMIPTRFYTPFNLTNPLASWHQSSDFVAIVTFYTVIVGVFLVLVQVHLSFVTLNSCKRHGKRAMWFRTFIELLLIIGNLFILTCFFLLCFRNELYEVPQLKFLFDTFDLVSKYISLDSPNDVLRNFNFNLNPKAMTIVYSLVVLIVVNGVFHLLCLCGRSHPLAFKWKKEYRRIAADNGKVVKHIVGRGRGYGYGYGPYAQVFASGYGDGIPTHVEYENYNRTADEKNVILIKYRPIASIIATMYNDVPAKLAPDLTICNEVLAEEVSEKINIITTNNNDSNEIETKKPEDYQRWFLPIYSKGFYIVDYNETVIHDLLVSFVSTFGDKKENIVGLARAMSIFYSLEVKLDSPYEHIYNPWNDRVYKDENIPEFTPRALEIFKSLDNRNDVDEVIDPYLENNILKQKSVELLSASKSNLFISRALALYVSLEHQDIKEDVYSPFEECSRFIGEIVDTDEIKEDKRIGVLFKEEVFMDRALSIYKSLDCRNDIFYKAYSPFIDAVSLNKELESDAHRIENLTLPVDVLLENNTTYRVNEIVESLDTNRPSIYAEIDSPFEKTFSGVELPEPWPLVDLPKIDKSKIILESERIEGIINSLSPENEEADIDFNRSKELADSLSPECKEADIDFDRSKEIYDSLSPENEEADIDFDRSKEIIESLSPSYQKVDTDDIEEIRRENIIESLSPENSKIDLNEHPEITDFDIDDRAYRIYVSLGEEHDEVKLLEKNNKVVDPFIEEEETVELPSPLEDLGETEYESIIPVDDSIFDYYEVVKVEPVTEETEVIVIADNSKFDYYEVVKFDEVIENQVIEKVQEKEETKEIEDTTLFDYYEVMKEEPLEEERVETKPDEVDEIEEVETSKQVVIEDSSSFDYYEVVKAEPACEEQVEEKIDEKVDNVSELENQQEETALENIEEERLEEERVEEKEQVEGPSDTLNKTEIEAEEKKDEASQVNEVIDNVETACEYDQFEAYEVRAYEEIDNQLKESEPIVEEKFVESELPDTPVEEENIDDSIFDYYEVVKVEPVTEENEVIKVEEKDTETRVEETPTETVIDVDETDKITTLPLESEEVPVVTEEKEEEQVEERLEEERVEEKEEEKEEPVKIISKPKKPITPVAPIKHDEVITPIEEEKVLEKINKPLHDIQTKKPDIKIKPVAPRHVPFNLKEFMIDKYDGYLTPEEAFTRGIAKVRSTVAPVVANRGNKKSEDYDNISTVDDLNKYRNQPKFDSTASKSKSIRELKKAIEEDKLKKKQLENEGKVSEETKPNKPITPIKPITPVKPVEKTDENKEAENNTEENKVLAPVSIRHRLNTKPKPVIKPVDPTKKK